MKMLILSRNPKLYSTRRLVEAAEQRGHEVRVINYLRCYINITSQQPKVIYGGELTPEETPVFESFVQTDTGQQYLSRSREMKDTLNNIANVELVAEDQSAMINRFENLLKQNAIESQKKFPLAVSLLIGPISVCC